MARFEPIEHDPFQVVKPTAPPAMEAVDYDPFAAAPTQSGPSVSMEPSTPALNPASQPRFNPAQSGGMESPAPQQRTLVADPTPTATPEEIGPMTSPIGDNEPPGANPSEPWAFTKGLWTTILEQNPKLFADALESFSAISGQEGVDPLATVLGSFSRDVRAAATDPGQYKMKGTQFTDIRSLDDALTFAGESAGQALGSSVMTIIPSVAGAAVGNRIGGRVGAVAGGALGAGAGSFIPAQGEVYGELKAAGLDNATAGRAALPAAAIIAGLDSVVPAQLVAQLGGMNEVKRQFARGLARRMGAAVAEGAKKEGVTEALQEVVKDAQVSLQSGKDFWTKENFLNWVNSGAAGAVGGGLLNAAGGLQRDQTTNQVQPGGTNEAAGAMGVAQPQPQTQPAMGTPIRVEAGRENFIQNEAPQTGEVPISMQEVSGTVQAAPTFYSPVGKFVAEKGQNVATADQWLNTINNAPGIKQEELADTGLGAFLNDAKARGEKITKGDLLREIEERSITLEERELSDEQTLFRGEIQPQYGAYVLPGDKEGYTELLLKLPEVEEKMPYVAPHFGAVRGNHIDTSRGNENLLAHARISERRDFDGEPVALIEEIQSDWHQAGRKQGYQGTKPDVGPLLDALDEKVNAAAEQGNPAAIGLINAAPEQLNYHLNRAVNADVITQAEAEAYIQNLQSENTTAVPNAPFKSSWDELTFKRVLRWAADKGYRRIAIANSKEQGRRYGNVGPNPPGWNDGQGGARGLSAEQMKGMQEFYDKKMPSLMKKWAKRLGGTITETSFFDTARGDGYVTIELPESGLKTIQSGLPQYSLMHEEQTTPRTADPNIMSVAQQLGGALEELAKSFRLEKKLTLILTDKSIKVSGKSYRNAMGMWVNYGNRHEIHVSTKNLHSAAAIWAVMTHELGHAIEYEHLSKASPEVKASIRAAYEEWLKNVKPSTTFRQLFAIRDNVAQLWAREEQGGGMDQVIKGASKRQYWVSFEEWFAEQVARWATTNSAPLTTVEKFFSGIAKTLMRMWAKASDVFNLPFQPAAAVADYLNTFHHNPPFADEIFRAHDFLTQQDNQRQMGEGEVGVPMQPETSAVRDRLESLFNGAVPGKVKKAIAYADKFSWLYKVFFGIHQVAQRNPHIPALQQYVEVISVAQLTKQQIMSSAHEVIKQWNQLGRKRSDQLGAFIDDVNNMVYRTPQEVTQKVSRMPTQVEFDDLVAKHGLDQETLVVFKSIAGTFRDHLTRYQAVLMKEAQKITDPKAKLEREQEIILMIAGLRNKPYFPAMRFGNYTVTIRDAANNVIHFETFETKRRQRLAAEDIKKQYGITNDKMQLGYLADQAQPMLGVPTQLLDLMGEKLALSPAQRDAMEQLKFELSPAQSFKHRFQHKRRIAGYSKDFRRAYANYFFHGANHMMRVMYADELRLLAEATRKDTKQFDATKRHQIANALSQHLKNWLDPKSDWQAIRSIAFLWSLAFSPAAATQNLMQTVMTSYPFLASKFGDHKAVPMLMRVMGDLSTFYKRGSYENLTEFEYQAISRGIKEGVITEAMAPELAGVADGGNFSGAAGEAFERGFTAVNEMGSKMFEFAEQFNRRVIFRAALKLAEANIGSKYVQEMVQKHNLKYKQLRGEGWTEAQAAAYVTALDSTHETQFRYGREFAPKFMQGGLMRTIFVFKTFITSYMIFLGHYPSAAVRSLLILGFLGGLMAQPGAEDLEGIIKMIGWRLFGKDWDVEKEARQFVLNLTGEDENGRQWADFALHGAARRGFGWPQLFDMLGGTVGIDVPMPTFDRSRAISGGTLLPVDFGALFGPPVQKTEQRIADQAQKASGAVFGAGFNIYKAAVNERLDVDDFKRWERAVPRFMGSVTRAWRYWNEGGERTQTGAPVVKFDPRDWEQMMEIAGVAAGYQPLRLSGYWDKTIAKREAAALWDVRRQVLMRQMGNAVRGGDEKEIDQVRNAINVFNDTLPEDARGKAITKKSLDASAKMQQRQRAATEAGTSMKKSDVPIYQSIDRMYPDYEAIVRKVR